MKSILIIIIYNSYNNNITQKVLTYSRTGSTFALWKDILGYTFKKTRGKNNFDRFEASDKSLFRFDNL